jgi:hypothetical protein
MPGNGNNQPIIVVIGHLVKDEIIAVDGTMNIALGGIAYNIAALCALMKQGKVHPICRIGKDVKKHVSDAFGVSPVFDCSGISDSNRPNIVNRLKYSHDGRREEWNSGKPSPLDIADISTHADAVMFNFISGNDVKLSDLKAFRNIYRGLIYCDYHSLSLGRDSSGKRYHRHHPRWGEYLSVVDIVQMNMAELSTIVRHDLTDIREIASATLNLHKAGPSIAIVTIGDRGVIISDRKREMQFHVPAVSISGRIDPTGCGDTLAAAFIYHYLQDGDMIRSLELANHFAAAKATFSGLEGFGRIDEILNSLGSIEKAMRI